MNSQDSAYDRGLSHIMPCGGRGVWSLEPIARDLGAAPAGQVPHPPLPHFPYLHSGVMTLALLPSCALRVR